MVISFDPDNRDTASVDEAAAQLATMSKADLIRLEHFARLRTAGLGTLDWEDLLHEAIDRVLSGSRKWPKAIPFVAFMCGTMRSIASEFWRDRAVRREIAMTDLMPQNPTGADVLSSIVDERPDPEREAAARQILKKIEGLFEGDAHAIAVLEGLANASTPLEVQQKAHMAQRSYSSAQKRIRRTIGRALREGRI